MRDLLPGLLPWWRSGAPAGLARVTATWASAPRETGAAMAVGPDGIVLGSVSGGCVEGAVYDLCREAAAAGVARTSRFGVSDGEAAAVGLTCGGTVEVLVEPVDRTAFPHLPVLAALGVNPTEEVRDAFGRKVPLSTGRVCEELFGT